jgi:hypothetical protein
MIGLGDKRRELETTEHCMHDFMTVTGLDGRITTGHAVMMYN